MTENPSPRIPVAVVIVGYAGENCILDCLDSVFESADVNVDVRVLFVDNYSPDEMRKRVEGNFALQIERGELKVTYTNKNWGFAGGNNIGWEAVQELWPDTQYLCLLNQDTIVISGWLGWIVEYMERHPNVGSAQPKILLHPDVGRINTAGNVSHFLGFGYCAGDGELDTGQYDGCHEIHYASGAAVVIRVEALKQIGLFDDAFFMYLEDAELGWKLKQIGYLNIVVSAAMIQHKHKHGSTLQSYYWLEKNRLWLLAVYYRLPTLLLILPAFFVMEIGQFWFAISQKLGGEKVRAWDDFLRGENLKRMWKVRRAAQARRVINDSAFMSGFSGVIESPVVNSWALKYIGNPVLGAYWAVARRLIFW
jgi:N-acetylglucosaminyl-diphospho-decaprenol L-rhamnosyltransferase